MPSPGATAQRSSIWAGCFRTALDLFSSRDLHPQRFCLSLSLGCLGQLQLVAYLNLNLPCIQELDLTRALHCWLLPHVPPPQPGRHTAFAVWHSCFMTQMDQTQLDRLTHDSLKRGLWVRVQGRRKASFISHVMIQRGATVCVGEVILAGVLIETGNLASADLGLVTLLTEGLLLWVLIPVFGADGVWEVLC